MMRSLVLFWCLVFLRAKASYIPERCSDDDVYNWTLSVHDQTELENFMEQATSFNDTSRCIQLSIMGGFRYRLDMIKLMEVKLGTSGGMIVVGTNGPVEIDCGANVSNIQQSEGVPKPISNTSLVIFDGLMFVKCPLPLMIEEVSTVVVRNCDFIKKTRQVNHEHGALMIFNSPNVVVKNCTFHNNTSDSYFTSKPFQGSGGALSIGYSAYLTTLNSTNVLVTNCVFSSNKAIAPLHLSTTQIFLTGIFSGRGGGLSMPINASWPVSITINNSVFMNNLAENHGGSFYCHIRGTVGNLTYLFANNIFMHNKALIGSGAINLVNYGFTAPYSTWHIILHNCTFESNVAQIAGCFQITPSFFGFSNSFLRIINCTFHNHTSPQRGVIDLTTFNYYKTRQHYEPIYFSGCIFDGNNCGNGATIDFGFQSGMFSNSIFSNNKGSAIRAMGSKLTFTGNVSFINNNAEGFDGGAIYMLTFSQMILYPGAHLRFVNNSGGLGASIVVKSETTLPFLTKNFDNPLCFIQYYDPNIPPPEWKEVSLHFENNKAIIGSAIYADRLDLCSWNSYYAPFYDSRNQILRWPFVTYGEGIGLNIDTGHCKPNSSNQLLAVQTPATTFIVDTKNVTAYPGETLHVAVSPYDEQKYLTSENFQIAEDTYHHNDASFVFNPTAQIINPCDSVFTVKYSIKLVEEAFDKMLNHSHEIGVSQLRTKSDLETKQFALTIKPCPPGHTLQITDSNNGYNEYECKCNTDDQNIIDCLPDESKIILEEGVWAHYVDTGSTNGMLESYHCPSGYCQCRRTDNTSEVCSSVYYYNDEDLQCVCDRQGTLCGKCQDGKGLSVLLNRCKSCSKFNLLLIPALVLIDVVLITAILISSVSIPAWLYPILFYVQVITIISQYFPAPFGVVQPYLQYISSAISLYFPYDFCLCSQMTAVTSYSLRYIPFLLTTIVSTVLFTAHRKCKVATSRRLSWKGLWLLILLLYTDVVNTSLTILRCPMLRNSNGQQSLRWYIDGTVECFAGEHIPLTIVASLVLVFCGLFIVFLTVVVKEKSKEHGLAKVLTSPYATEYYWWTPIELLRRLLFIVCVIILPGNLAPVLLMTMVYVAVYAYVKPYRSLYINILEMFTLVDIALLILIASTTQFKDPVFIAKSDIKNLTDSCGKIINISEHATMMVPFYYLPLIVLIVLLTKKSFVKLIRYLSHKFTATTCRNDVAIELTTPLIHSEPTQVQRFEITFDAKQNPVVVSLS